MITNAYHGNLDTETCHLGPPTNISPRSFASDKHPLSLSTSELSLWQVFTAHYVTEYNHLLQQNLQNYI
jgi:hypothetical protein